MLSPVAAQPLLRSEKHPQFHYPSPLPPTSLNLEALMVRGVRGLLSGRGTGLTLRVSFPGGRDWSSRGCWAAPSGHME